MPFLTTSGVKSLLSLISFVKKSIVIWIVSFLFGKEAFIVFIQMKINKHYKPKSKEKNVRFSNLRNDES